MMSKTHLAIGIASSLLVSSSIIEAPADIAIAIAGGAIGGVLADVDILKTDTTKDAIKGEKYALCITAFATLLDIFFQWGILEKILNSFHSSIIGMIGFIILWIIGYTQKHRHFTHSLISMILFTICTGIIYPNLGVAVLFSYFSHLAIDLLNKQGIQLFWPFRKYLCLKICYADRTGNTLLMYVGLVLSILLLLLNLKSI